MLQCVSRSRNTLCRGCWDVEVKVFWCYEMRNIFVGQDKLFSSPKERISCHKPLVRGALHKHQGWQGNTFNSSPRPSHSQNNQAESESGTIFMEWLLLFCLFTLLFSFFPLKVKVETNNSCVLLQLKDG